MAKLFKKAKDKATKGLGLTGATAPGFRGSTEVTGMPAGTAVPLAPAGLSPTLGGAITPMGGGGRRVRGGRR